MLQKVESKKFIAEVSKINKRVAALLLDCEIKIEIDAGEGFCSITYPSDYHREQVVKAAPAGENLAESEAPVFHGLTNAFEHVERWVMSHRIAKNEIETVLEKLTKEAHEIAKSKGWWDNKPTFGDFIANVHSELSEAFEDYKNGKLVTELFDSGTYAGDIVKPGGVPIELADAVIRILDFCGYHGIDLGKAILTKMEFNKTRPYRHGGKKI